MFDMCHDRGVPTREDRHRQDRRDAARLTAAVTELRERVGRDQYRGLDWGYKILLGAVGELLTLTAAAISRGELSPKNEVRRAALRVADHLAQPE